MKTLLLFLTVISGLSCSFVTAKKPKPQVQESVYDTLSHYHQELQKPYWFLSFDIEQNWQNIMQALTGNDAQHKRLCFKILVLLSENLPCVEEALKKLSRDDGFDIKKILEQRKSFSHLQNVEVDLIAQQLHHHIHHPSKKRRCCSLDALFSLFSHSP